MANPETEADHPGGALPGEKSVDREKTCPLLLRVFTSYSRHNRLDEFEKGKSCCTGIGIFNSNFGSCNTR